VIIGLPASVAARKNRRRPARVNAKEPPCKGQTGWGVCKGHSGYTAGPTRSWEASDQHERRDATSPEVAFIASGVLIGQSGADQAACLPDAFGVSGRWEHLPAAPPRCTIRLAYRAADAGHPNRVEQARRTQGKSAGRAASLRQPVADVPIGRALPEETTGRTLSIPAAEPGSCRVTVWSWARPLETRVGCARSAAPSFHSIACQDKDRRLPRFPFSHSHRGALSPWMGRERRQLRKRTPSGRRMQSQFQSCC
jgi:hypothetical protein